MRVLLIGDCGSVHVRQRTSALIRRGHAFYAISPRPGEIEGAQVTTPGAVIESQRRPSWLAVGKALLTILWTVRSETVDIVHIHYPASIAAWIWLMSGSRTPALVSVMGGDILDEEQTPLPCSARWMTQWVIRRANHTTSKSEYLASVLKSRGIIPTKVSIVTWGVDHDLFFPVDGFDVKGELGLRRHHRVLLSSRNLKSFYNIELILDAFSIIHAELADTRLVLIGAESDPLYVRRLRARAEELNITEMIVWAGSIAPKKMRAFYSMADVVISVPPSDGLPQTIVEAMACGTPSVTLRLPGLSDIVKDRINGIFAAPDSGGVATAVLSILHDQCFAEKLSKNAFLTSRMHPSLEYEARRVSNIYQELHALGGASPAPLLVRICFGVVLLAYAFREALVQAISSGFRVVRNAD